MSTIKDLLIKTLMRAALLMLLFGYVHSVTAVSIPFQHHQLAPLPNEVVQDPVSPEDVIVLIVNPANQTIVWDGTATFIIWVVNASNDINLVDVEVTSQTVPDCNRTIGNFGADSNFPPYQCTSSNVKSAFTNNVKVQGRNPVNNQTYDASKNVRVELLSLDTQVIADPTSMPEPGGPVDFSLTITNNGSINVELTGLNSAQFGNLADPDNPILTKNTCGPENELPELEAGGETYSCTFTAQVTGQPADYNIVITATGQDTESMTISNSDVATIRLGNVEADMELTLTASSSTVPAPGGSVSFNVSVENTSLVDAITINKLQDSVIGDLNEVGSCSTPQTISAGAQYECDYASEIEGDAGDSETRIVTSTGIDDDDPPAPISRSDETNITIVPPPEYVIRLPVILHQLDEDNDICEESYPLMLNHPYHFFPEDSEDWYLFQLPQQGDLLVSLTNFVPKDGQIVVYKGQTCENLVIIGSNGNFDSAKLVPLGTQPAGRYFVRVFTASGFNNVDPYQLEVTFN